MVVVAPKDSLEQMNMVIHKQQMQQAVPQVALEHAAVHLLIVSIAAGIAIGPASSIAPTEG